MFITNSKTNHDGFRQRTMGREIKIGPLSIQFVVVIILVALALLYLAQSTQGATRNYKIRELEDGKAKLELENDRLTIEVTRLKSLSEIKKSAESLGLESDK